MRLIVTSLLVTISCVRGKTIRNAPEEAFSVESDFDLPYLVDDEGHLDSSGGKNRLSSPCAAEKNAFVACAHLTRSCADCLNDAWKAVATGRKTCNQFASEICDIPDACPCLRASCRDDAFAFYGCVLNAGTGGACPADLNCPTDIRCVGEFFCSIYQKLPCEQLGCVWTGDFLWGSCSRGPDTLTCEDLSPELCQLAQGCTYMTQCIAEQGGEPVPVCYGTRPETCSHRKAQSNCKRMDGCVWVGDWLWGYCEGTPIPCEDYSNNPKACDWEEGCRFSYDPPMPGETFCESMLPMKADLSCVPDDSNCYKCRDTVDGHVCFYYPGIVMKIEGTYCQSVRECSDYSIAFDCGNAIANAGTEPKCVGQDCDGNCIWKAPEHAGA